ncbi:hypothetical protein Gotur_019509 [Gossypium turneri]
MMESDNLRTLARNWHIKVSYTPCSANTIADSMAALSRNDPIGLKIYEYLLKTNCYESVTREHW